MNYDVVIIGAGVIGGMVARELSRYRLKVCLLEKENDVAMGASKANSGIIHGGYDPEPDTLKAKMNTAGIDLLYRAAEELHVPHKHNGSMIVAVGSEEEKTVEMLYRRGAENGISGLSLISGDEARKMEPKLSPAITKVLLVPNAGIICPYELTVAAIGNAMDNGVTLKRNFAVAEIKEVAGGIEVISTTGECVRAAYAVNAAGAYSDRVAKMAGDDFFSILPRAGEYLILDKSEGDTVKHTIFQVPSAAGKGVLVTPTVDNNLLVGPTATLVDAPENSETTPEGIAAVSAMAPKSVPSVNLRKVITSFSGVRSSVKHGDFILEFSKSLPALFHAAAVDSPGLTSCVAIAKYTVEALAGKGLALDEDPAFCPTREDPHAFRHMSDEEKDAYIKKNPAYGKIICRCEGVSEGEIRDAITRAPGALDIDGVKRRTRSGMGRCQGGFCAPFVMKLIAELNEQSLEEVTKKGNGSYMVTGKL